MAASFRRKQQRKAQFASSVTSLRSSRAGSTPRGASWQDRAFGFYDSCGEIWYASRFYSRALKRLSWGLEVEDEQGKMVPLYDENGQPAIREADQLAAALDRVMGDDGAGIGESYGKLMFLAGEALLVGFGEMAGEQWRVLSRGEIKIDGDRIEWRQNPAASSDDVVYRNLGDDLPGVIGPGEAIAFRFWQPHPRWSGMADSPMRAVLELCEELLLLTTAVGARAKNRTAGNGMLLVPEEVTLPDVDHDDPSNAATDLLQQLILNMTTPIQDPSSAAAVVPFVLRLGGEYIDKVRHLDLGQRDAAYPESALRMETIKRIALGLDLPPEILLGVAEANHWTAWQIDESAWTAHLAPMADQMADDLADALVRPVALALGVEQRVDVVYDASAVVSQPDRGKNAVEAHDREAISDAALRKSLGFAEADAPDASEMQRRVEAKRPKPGGVVAPEPVNAPPVQQEAVVVGSVETWALACDLALDRCRELAGSRLRSKLPATVKQEAVDVANADLYAWATTAHVPALPDPQQMVAGGGDALDRLMQRWNVPGPLRQTIVTEVEMHAATTLRHPEASVPDAAIQMCRLATAGGWS